MNLTLWPQDLQVGDDLGDAIVADKPKVVCHNYHWWEYFKSATVDIPIVWKTGLQAFGIRTVSCKNKVSVDRLDDA